MPEAGGPPLGLLGDLRGERLLPLAGRGGIGTRMQEAPGGLSRAPRGLHFRWRDRPVSVVTACGDWVSISLSPPRAVCVEGRLLALSLFGCDQRPRNRLTFGPNILWRARWSSRRPLLQSRRSGFATAPPTTCSQGTRSPKPRQLFRQGFGYLKSEQQPNGRRYNELARNPPRNPHGFQQVIHIRHHAPERTANGDFNAEPRRTERADRRRPERAGSGCCSQLQKRRSPRVLRDSAALR